MSIEKNTSDFISFFSQLYLIPSSQVLVIPDFNFNSQIDFNFFSLKSGKNFEKIYFSPKSGQFTEKQIRQDAGVLYEKKIEFRIPKNRSKVTSWLRGKQNILFSAMVKTENEKWVFIEKNLSIIFSRIFLDSPQFYSGYNIALTGKHSQPVRFVSNFIESDLKYITTESGDPVTTEDGELIFI